ncbi:MAG: sortase [Clostridia bacterium]|nr:sortase [Clostridia bacterium]
MNQILVTKKLYITPELKRKKKIYKFDFILSIFLVIVLISIYIYAENDRNKSEEVSHEILAEMREEPENITDDTTANNKDILVIVLNDENGEYGSTNQQSQNQISNNNTETSGNNDENEYKTTRDGYNYKSVGIIDIPKIDVNYPILEGETMSVEETDSLLKISPCKFWGPNINEVGNYCIVGHNYRNSRFFSHVPELEPGDTFTIEQPNVRTLTYEVYDKYTVVPENVSCTSQLTGGKKEVTLITCTNDSSARVIIKAREVR